MQIGVFTPPTRTDGAGGKLHTSERTAEQSHQLDWILVSVSSRSMVDLDQRVRLAAFEFLDRLRLTHGEILPHALLIAGFEFEGHRAPLLAPQGIFKPAVLKLPLSISTVPP